MTIEEYWQINKKGFSLLIFGFAEEFNCWIHGGKVWIEEYGEGAFELKHIKTIDDYKILHKLLTGQDIMINEI